MNEFTVKIKREKNSKNRARETHCWRIAWPRTERQVSDFLCPCIKKNHFFKTIYRMAGGGGNNKINNFRWKSIVQTDVQCMSKTIRMFRVIIYVFEIVRQYDNYKTFVGGNRRKKKK